MNQTVTETKSPFKHRVFRGKFEHPKFAFQAEMHIDEIRKSDDNRKGKAEASTKSSEEPLVVSGKIIWRLEKSPKSDEQSKIGMTAIEYVSGTFNSHNQMLDIAGYAIDDPNKLNIALDHYQLTMSEKGGAEQLSGGTAAHTDGLGKVNMIGSTKDMSPPIVLSREVDCSIGELWSLWTENEKLKKWLCEDAKVSTKHGALYELFWEPDHPERNSTQGCIIINCEQKKVLGFTWKGPVPFAEIMNTTPPPTYVLVEFKELDKNRSSVKLTHFGWGAGEKWNEAKAWQENAWKGAFSRMF